jgi:hypothetical protein
MIDPEMHPESTNHLSEEEWAQGNSRWAQGLCYSCGSGDIQVLTNDSFSECRKCRARFLTPEWKKVKGLANFFEPIVNFLSNYGQFYTALYTQSQAAASQPLVKVANPTTYETAKLLCRKHRRHLTAIKTFFQPIRTFLSTWSKWTREQEIILTRDVKACLQVQEESMTEFLTNERTKKRHEHDEIRRELEAFESDLPLSEPNYHTPGTRTTYSVEVINPSSISQNYMKTEPDMEAINQLVRQHGHNAKNLLGDSVRIIEKVKPVHGKEKGNG